MVEILLFAEDGDIRLYKTLNFCKKVRLHMPEGSKILSSSINNLKSHIYWIMKSCVDRIRCTARNVILKIN
jgi:hypothetical protein